MLNKTPLVPWLGVVVRGDTAETDMSEKAQKRIAQLRGAGKHAGFVVTMSTDEVFHSHNKILAMRGIGKLRCDTDKADLNPAWVLKAPSGTG